MARADGIDTISNMDMEPAQGNLLQSIMRTRAMFDSRMLASAGCIRAKKHTVSQWAVTKVKPEAGGKEDGRNLSGHIINIPE